MCVLFSEICLVLKCIAPVQPLGVVDGVQANQPPKQPSKPIVPRLKHALSGGKPSEDNLGQSAPGWQERTAELYEEQAAALNREQAVLRRWDPEQREFFDTGGGRSRSHTII